MHYKRKSENQVRRDTRRANQYSTRRITAKNNHKVSVADSDNSVINVENCIDTASHVGVTKKNCLLAIAVPSIWPPLDLSIQVEFLLMLVL